MNNIVRCSPKDWQDKIAKAASAASNVVTSLSITHHNNCDSKDAIEEENEDV